MLIDNAIESKLHAYIYGICKNLKTQVITINGTSDHIHLLCKVPTETAPLKLIKEVKGSSSRWIKMQGTKYSNFYWQGGYGAFSVNPKGVSILKEYIDNQKIHHKKFTFETEYLALLKKLKIDFNPKYLFD